MWLLPHSYDDLRSSRRQMVCDISYPTFMRAARQPSFGAASGLGVQLKKLLKTGSIALGQCPIM
jgi:hypothetical protein